MKLTDLDVIIIDKKLDASTLIRGKELYYCTYNDFKTSTFILKDKTNDRMKYQKGCFLYFQNAVIANNCLLLPANFGRIRKYTIPSSGKTVNKKSIYEYILQNHDCYK
ncbi:MAG: hypothetical protein KBT35_05710 [Firmicutes bacterium]|nr:hypothetical protein [Candidatus Colivicinus equi]